MDDRFRIDFRTCPDQESIITAAKTYFERGKGRCVTSDGVCVYRRDDGHTCIAGAFIPDELYDERMERQDIGAISYDWVGNLTDLNSQFLTWLKKNIQTLLVLQELHDSRDSWCENKFIVDLDKLDITHWET